MTTSLLNIDYKIATNAISQYNYESSTGSDTRMPFVVDTIHYM